MHVADKVTVIGAGAWGTTIANVLAQNSSNVALWTARTEHAHQMKTRRENADYLPGVLLHERVAPTCAVPKAVEGADLIVWAIPIQYLRDRVRTFVSHMPNDAVSVNLGKGLEVGTWARPSEILGNELKSYLALGSLGGPNIASEVASGPYAVATLALTDYRYFEETRKYFSTATFVVRTSADLIGLEVTGALKNVIAIAGGLCDGMRLGVNIKSAVVTTGLREMRELGVGLGANPDSFLSESALGDLVASSFSREGRNRRVGEYLGRGLTLQQAVERLAGRISEGVHSCHACYELQMYLGLDLPLVTALHWLLTGKLDAAGAIEKMLHDCRPGCLAPFNRLAA